MVPQAIIPSSEDLEKQGGLKCYLTVKGFYYPPDIKEFSKEFHYVKKKREWRDGWILSRVDVLDEVPHCHLPKLEMRSGSWEEKLETSFVIYDLFPHSQPWNK